MIDQQAWADLPVVEFPAGTTVRVGACDQNEGDTLTYAWSKVSGPGAATFATPTGIASAVSFSEVGGYLLRVTVSDGQGGVATSDVAVTVNAAGSPPVILGNYSSMTIGEGTYRDEFTVRLSKVPSNTVTVAIARAGDASITLNNTPTFSSSDWNTPKFFRLVAAQDADATDGTATFTISAPGCVSATLTVTVADNDATLTVADGTGGTVSPAGATVVTKGAATAITAVHADGYCFSGWTVTSGSASFANAGTPETTVALSVPATIQANFALIGVVVANQAPAAYAQSVNTAQNVARAITLTGNDPEGSNLTYTVVTGPAHGTLTGTGASRTYTPATNYTGADSFTFTVNDGALDSAPATVSITVTAAADPNLDSDGDGILDWWMLKHFGHATGMAGDLSRADDDPDGDGMSNWKEWRAGTDPTNGNSCLTMSGMAPNPALYP